ncbi:MAG: PLP-dependent aminotransferase family protein [Thermoanaerobaculia bacterium]
MMRTTSGAVFGGLRVAPGSLPLFRQIYRTVREAILDGRLAPGTRLPSTRTLARDLCVSRTTAEEAFAQLQAEGFVERRVGSGTYVAAIERTATPRPHGRPPRPAGPRPISSRAAAARRHAAFPQPAPVRAFSSANPDLDAFPLGTWRAVVARCSRRTRAGDLGSEEPAGNPLLRETIATYVTTSRGVVCTAGQVVVLTSSQQALDLIATLLLDPGDEAWLEEPGYPGARAALLAHGARIVPVPVDTDGLDVAEGVRRSPRARLAYTTPSHQYPLGPTLSLERRLALLDWARREGSWIVEDDYDSEFRYEGRPLAAIQGIDENARVLYVGTFSKSLFPSLRLAYAVVPEDLVEPLVRLRGSTDGYPPSLAQRAVSEFFADGHFGVHLRRMRELYRERRDALVEAAERRLAGVARLGPTEAGLHAVLHLAPGSDDRAAAERAARHGIDTLPLALFRHDGSSGAGLFLGYAALSAERIEEGMRGLARALGPGGS